MIKRTDIPLKAMRLPVSEAIRFLTGRIEGDHNHLKTPFYHKSINFYRKDKEYMERNGSALVPLPRFLAWMLSQGDANPPCSFTQVPNTNRDVWQEHGGAADPIGIARGEDIACKYQYLPQEQSRVDPVMDGRNR